MDSMENAVNIGLKFQKLLVESEKRNKELQAKVEAMGKWIKTNLNNTFQLTEEELEESLENILAEDN